MHVYELHLGFVTLGDVSSCLSCDGLDSMLMLSWTKLMQLNLRRRLLRRTSRQNMLCLTPSKLQVSIFAVSLVVLKLVNEINISSF